MCRMQNSSCHARRRFSDQSDSNKIKYYEAMLRYYSKAGAFPGKSFDEVWKHFEETRAIIAQMATLTVPVCNSESCLESTTTLNEIAVLKLVADSSDTIDPTLMVLGTTF